MIWDTLEVLKKSFLTRALASNDDKENDLTYIANYDTTYGTTFSLNNCAIFTKYLSITRPPEQAYPSVELAQTHICAVRCGRLKNHCSSHTKVICHDEHMHAHATPHHMHAHRHTHRHPTTHTQSHTQLITWKQENWYSIWRAKTHVHPELSAVMTRLIPLRMSGREQPSLCQLKTENNTFQLLTPFIHN